MFTVTFEWPNGDVDTRTFDTFAEADSARDRAILAGARNTLFLEDDPVPLSVIESGLHGI